MFAVGLWAGMTSAIDAKFLRNFLANSDRGQASFAKSSEPLDFWFAFAVRIHEGGRSVSALSFPTA